MKTRLALRLSLILPVAAVLLSSGCGSSGKSARSQRTYPVHPEMDAEQTTPVATAPQPNPAASGSRCGPSVASQTYPAQGAVRLDVRAPSQVPMNVTFEYTIRVTNVSDVMVSDVFVTERLPRNFKFQRSDPPASPHENRLVWALGSLAPEASRDLTISGMAISTDCLTHCATVDFLIPTCANIEVVEPKLVLSKTMPRETILCDPIPVSFVVANSGTGDIEDVKIMDMLPPGLQTEDGSSQINFNAGTLEAGKSKKYSVKLKAARTGEYVNIAVASSSSGLKAEATAKTVVFQPVLVISKSGPERVFLGRPLTYQITVANKGDAPALNAVAEDTVPDGVRAVRASSGGKVSGSKVVWELGTIAINASKTVSVTYVPERAGTYSNVAEAAATCADAVTASASTSVEGIAAVLLEVIDLADPIEVGGEETYVITATNQGSVADTNVQITVVLEES